MYEDQYKLKRNDTIRIIAIIAMTIDHIGAFIYPHIIILRIIGRFTMPVFAYAVAFGMLKTKNTEKYLIRLFIFALVSQLPFNLAGARGLSIISTIFLTALFFYIIKKQTPLCYLLSLVPAAATVLIDMDYGIYFLMLSACIYFFIDKRGVAFITGTAVTLAFSLYYYNNPIQLWSIIGLFFALLQDTKISAKLIPHTHMNKYFFYIYYPLHLLMIYGIVQLMGR